MYKPRLIIYVLLIVTFVGVSTVRGVELKKDGFSISLPDGWVEIPRDVVEKKTARSAQNAPAQHFDCAFQLASATNWFELPYIVVQIKNTGRTPESQLKKVEEYPVQENLDTDKKRFRPVISDIKAGKLVYDKETNTIWSRLEFDIAKTGPLSCIACTIPTEKGHIQVMGYSHRENYPQYEAVFQSVALSVSPEPWLAYKSRWSDRLPPVVSCMNWEKLDGSTLKGAVIGAILGGLIALIVALIKKKNRGKDTHPVR